MASAIPAAPGAGLQYTLANRLTAAFRRGSELPTATPLRPVWNSERSFMVSPATSTLSPRTVAKVEVCGFDCLLSADRFFDVLPRGVSKGPTLMRLVEALELDREAVLVAGDTMNDLSLFQTGFKGVAVGNSEPRLKAAVSRLPNVYCSPSPGAAGIADAIRHFNFKGGQRHEKIIAGHRLSPAAQ